MSEWQEIFTDGMRHSEPDGDFEEKVFFKIRKKKKQRKIGFTVMAAASVVMLLSLFQLFRPSSHSLAPVLQNGKKEIPLSENLLFSASNNQTRYAIEPVSYQKNRVAQDAARNQL
jgi:hypothetical protein